MLTNQRPEAIEVLQQMIKEHPEKYQTYELLAEVYEDEGRTLERANQREEARANFVKAAANYEQCLLINPTHSNNYLRLAELFLGRLKENDRAVKLLAEARRRFRARRSSPIISGWPCARRSAREKQSRSSKKRSMKRS